jgi:hypothetical protein
MHCIRDGWGNLSFEQTLEDEKKRIQDNWGWSYHHVQTGMYYEQIKAYLDNFKNVRIYLFEELENKKKFLNDIYDFIGAKRIKQPEETTRYNLSGYPRNKLINKLVIRKNIIKKITKPIISMLLSEEKINQLMLTLKKGSLQKRAMKKETKNKLNIIFKNNIEKTSKLINKDLSHWTK